MATDNGETPATKPSFWSTREKIENGWKQQPNPGAAYLDTLDVFRKKAEAIAASRFDAAERRRQRDELEAATWAALDPVEQRAIHRATYDHGQEEGSIRARSAQAGEDPQALFKQQRAAALSQRAADAKDAYEVVSLLADAELADDESVRAVLSAGRKRLATIVAEARVPSARTAAQQRAAEFDARAEAWGRQHPSPSQRLRQLENEQGNLTMAIQASAQFAARMYGLRRPADGPALRPVPSVPNTSRIVEGPAFDALLAGRNSTNVRR